jgi:ubiquinone biosynthesis protein UbiJ
MKNTSPFSFLESIASRFQPPDWLVDEGQQRLVLFLNHVLLQEKQAQERLMPQKGRVVHLRWALFAVDLVVTPAGLVDRAPPSSAPDLVLSVDSESPLTVVQSVLAGKAPPVRIEGDVQLAADIGWLAENLRWDAEEDLSRLIGDAPAHALAGAGRRLAAGLKQFLTKVSRSPAAQAPAGSASVPSSVASAMPPERRAASVAPLPQAPVATPQPPARDPAAPDSTAPAQSEVAGKSVASAETPVAGPAGHAPFIPPGASA